MTFYPLWPVEEFLQTLDSAIHINIYELRREEEIMFIRFYGLATNHLKCNKAINLRELTQHMPRLSSMFEFYSKTSRVTCKTSEAVLDSSRVSRNKTRYLTRDSSVYEGNEVEHHHSTLLVPVSFSTNNAEVPSQREVLLVPKPLISQQTANVKTEFII
jgi:hypothetical protein